jgi:hypothetical protein
MINYMAGAGHYDYGQHIDHRAWRETIIDMVHRFSRRHKVAFICHDRAERILAESLHLSDVPLFCPHSIEEYCEIACQAKAGVFNRMHACVVFAGLGIPSIGVGVDSRMLMVQEMGLATVYVKEATASDLEQRIDQLLVVADAENERLRVLQQETKQRYMTILETVL